ncbi:MAG: ribulose phosphate epimerase [candidate division Zixibacteria bacterium DG_27]|nr:MAG: ribulose phosphate epimerase [candidate division Zixibacteria bacterium DG_27]
MEIIVAPSLLSCDFSRLKEEVETVEAAGADWIHLDVMDGHFVPNITFGPGLVEAVRRCTKLPLDVHLMIDNPDDYLERFIQAGADWLTIHQEIAPHLHRTLARIRELGVKAGVSVNPSTPFSTVIPVMEMADLLLIMTVNPGFGGQKFIPSVLAKIREARAHIESRKLNTKIEVDGGIGPETSPLVKEAGAEVLVAGASIFKSGDYRKTIEQIRGSKP